MSAYAPSLPRTADLHGLDRALVQAGLALAALGRRRAAARAERLARAAASRQRDAYRDAVVQRRQDNAAQLSPLALR